MKPSNEAVQSMAVFPIPNPVLVKPILFGGALAGQARVLRIKPANAVLPLAGFDPSPLRV